MKKILVPIDFSENAFKAARFAAFLAESRAWKLEICHVYQYPPFYSDYQSEKQNQTDKELALLEAGKKMDVFVERLQQLHPGIKIQDIFLFGNLEDTIIEQAGKTGAVLIVMGTKGASFIKYTLFGSTTYGVVQKTTIPVLVIPNGIKRFTFNRVGFTTNFHAVEIPALYDFIELMGNHIEIIPFHLYATNRDAEEAKMEVWKRKASHMITYRPFTIRMSRMRQYMAGMLHFIKKENLHALAMTKINKGIFTSLFGKNVIKMVVHQCSVPILFFPEE